MKTTINLNAELREWLDQRLSETLGDNQGNTQYVVFNIHEAKDNIFRLFYDYQVRSGWPHVAENTAMMLGISEMHVYRMAKKRHKMH